MAIIISHPFVSTKPDGTDDSLVQPSAWNDDHAVTGTLEVANGGTGANSAANARTNLGLGTVATQNSNNVSITGGSIAGVTISSLDANTTFQDNTDPTKQMQFELSSITGGQTSVLTVPDADGTVALLGNKLSDFAATTSAELAGVISDETGSGALVFGTSPTLTTPVLGVATATSINKVAITAPATGSTLTVADGKTLTASNTLTLAGTDSTTLTFQGTDTYVGRATTDILTNKTLTSPAINGTVTTTGLTLPAVTLGGTVTSNGQSFSGTIANLGTVTTADINGGTIDGAVIGGATPAAITGTTITANTGLVGPHNGTVGATTPAAGTFTTLTSTGNATLGDAEATDTHAIKGATTLLANSSSAALTVTQTGVGNAFVVEDSASTDTTPFVVTATGLVGVGSSNPGSYLGPNSGSMLLHGQGSGFSPQILLWNTANDSSGSYINFRKDKADGAVTLSGDDIATFEFTARDPAGSYLSACRIVAEVDGTPGTNDMPGRLVFSTTADGASSPTERMRIDSSGNVGIGVTPAAQQKLIIGGTYPSSGTNSIIAIAQGTIPSATTGAAQMFRSVPSTEAAAFTLGALTHYYCSQGTIGATSAVTSQYGYFAESTLTGATNNYGFYSNIAAAAGRWNFYAAGTAANYFGGLVDISAASAGQIKFPSGTSHYSADPNTLDDYEEGTFTPAVAFGGASTGVTYSSQAGVYTKIGRVVYFSASVILTSNGSSTGSATVTGLPFTCTAAINFVASMRASSGFAAGSLDRPLFVQVLASGTSIAMLRVAADAATASSGLTDVEVTDTASFIISGTYTI
jgi:hypothetical protein